MVDLGPSITSSVRDIATEGQSTTPSQGKCQVGGTKLQDRSTFKDTKLDTVYTGSDYGLHSENNLMYKEMSPGGTYVSVFDECALGKCNCSYSIAGCPLQLKPCRFDSIILSESNSWAVNYMGLLWSITDGFPIIQGEVPVYACSNYNSILEPECKMQMDVIIRKELAEGVISKVDFDPHCIHALGAVPKPGGKIRPITNCSR